jgi:perosamine synthetase
MTSSLAINGGTPIRTKPWQESNAIGAEELAAATRVLKERKLSLFQGAWKPHAPYNFLGGPEVQAMEAFAKDLIGVKHVVSINSATSGLSAAVGALGLGYGDEVIVSPYTMSACAVAPLWYGAIPVFADVDERTGCLDPTSIKERITHRTKGIIVVHQFGIPAEMDEIMTLARAHGIKVIEDCAQAWGATYKGKSVGTIGDIGVHSFNVHKTIQCGEGGLCLTNDDRLALRLQMIRNHGEAVIEGAGHTNLENIVGGNFRLTELQAAIALEQLKKLPDLNTRRIALVKRLSAGLKKFAYLTVPDPGADRVATYYVYPLRYHAKKNGGIPRADFTKMLAAEGIPFAGGYVKPLYLLPLFQEKRAFTKGYPWTATENAESKPSYAAGICPVAERLHTDELLLQFYLCDPQTEADVDDIVAAVQKLDSAISRNSQ